MKNRMRLTGLVLFFVTLFSFQFSLQYALALVPLISFKAEYPVFSRNNSQLVYISYPYDWNKAKIIKMNSKNGAIIKSVPLKLNPKTKIFAATPDGFKFLATTPKGIAVIHNGTGKVLRTLPYPAKRYFDADAFRQSDDGVLLAMPAISPNSRKIYVIHTGSGKLMHTVDLLKGEKWTRYPSIRGMGFSPRRRYLAYVYEAPFKELTLHVYDLYKKIETLRLKISSEQNHEGKIQFSKNGNYLIFSGRNMKQLTLVDLKKHSLQTLKLGYSSFSGFTPDDQNLILVQSYKKQILLNNIKTGKKTKIPLKFERKDGVYDGNIIQSADRTLLALPLRARDYKKMNNFLLINAQNGRILRQIKSSETVVTTAVMKK